MSNPRTIRLARSRPAECGVALVTTVIVVAVLAVVAVAFMQSVTTDRLSARISKEYMQARLAADAGAAMAQSMVAGLITRYPDSATVWQNIGGGAGGVAGTNNEVTVLYVRAQTADLNRGARPGQFGGEVALRAQPLISRTGTTTEQINTNLVSLTNLASFLPFNTITMVNLNATNLYRPDPLIGNRGGVAPVTAAQWIYLTMNGGATNATNPAIARYAFWVEDESFKVNVNVATNGPRGNTSLGLSAAEARLDGAWGATNNNAALRSADAGEVISARTALGGRFPTASTAAVPAGLSDATAADELRFLTTANSAGLDLSRGGFKRFNINSITNGISGPADTNNIRTNLNRGIAAITNSNSMPNFGQRFYRLTNSPAGINATNAVSNNHAAIYYNKIAANILDYIDSDDQPTYINNDAGFSIRAGGPDLADNSLFNEGIGGEGINRMAAMGAEARPFLFGYAIGVQLTNMNPPGFQSTNSGGSGPPVPNEAEFGMLVDHYFEFWNPSTRDIVVGVGNNTNESYLDGLFLQVANAPGWIDRTAGATFAEPGSKDFRADIPAGTRFPANGTTLVTTAPLADAQRFAPSAQNIVSIHTSGLDDMRSVSGTVRHVTTNTIPGTPLDRSYGLSLNYRNPAGSQLDFETEVLLGSPFGVVELFPALTLNSMVVWARSNNAVFTNRTTLFGNLVNSNPDGLAPRSTEGDPRTLLEQLQLQPIATGSMANPNQTRLFVDNSSPIGGPNTTYTRPTEWFDYSVFTSGAANAPMIVRNDAMTSIGELGHLIDPARVSGSRGSGTPSLTNVIYARSGGRTFRVGQSEHPRWYDGNQLSASRTWTSWRLADIFTTTAASNSATGLDPQGNLTNSLGVVRGTPNLNGAVVTIPGLINPNGMLRDRGAVLRSALHNLSYSLSPEGAPGLAGLPLNDFRLNGVVNSMSAHLTNASAAGLPNGALNAFWERGEISQLPIFNTGNIPTQMSNKFDRGREELVRRSIEMITTRGSIFSVYAIGQTLQGTNVTGTARLKQTFQIEPQFATADAFDDNFNPGQAVRVSRRFAAPTNYTTRVMQTSYD